MTLFVAALRVARDPAERIDLRLSTEATSIRDAVEHFCSFGHGLTAAGLFGFELLGVTSVTRTDAIRLSDSETIRSLLRTTPLLEVKT